MFKVSLISIGDEICIGQIVNTNASWIAAKCTNIGASVTAHSVIGDDRDELISELDRLVPKSGMVILTGGLGPTYDDITKKVLTEYFKDKLVLHEPTLKYLEKLFKIRGYTLTERNREQAMVPSKAKILDNKVGTAPGMLFEHNGTYIVSLPGVPAEMKYIMSNSILPHIENIISETNEDIVFYKNFITSGIPESMLADLIGDTEKILESGTLAFLPSYKGVKLRVGISARSFKEAEKRVNKIGQYLYNRAGRFIIGTEDESLSSIVGKLLSELNATISVAESCTGGMLGAELTKISGSSKYFTGGAIVYSNMTKIKILGVDEDILEKFGAVSEEVAKELAKNVRIKFGTDFGIGITGIAGPTGGTKEKPVGTVWISLADENVCIAQRFVFSNDRDVNRERAVGTALNILLKRLMEFKDKK